MSKPRPALDFELIEATVIGRWVDTIYPAIGISFKNGNHKIHQPCPNCDGDDRFRCDDNNGTGSFFCSGCGAGVGYSMVNRMMNFKEKYDTMEFIASALNIDGVKAQSTEQRDKIIADSAKRSAENKAKADKERKQGLLDASNKAQSIWNNAKDVDPTHAYLVKKDVEVVGIRQNGDKLVIPMYYYNAKTQKTTLVNVQQIDPTGDKKFIWKGLVTGCYTLIGDVDPDPQEPIFIAEGYATAITIYEAMEAQYPVVICYNAGNTAPVAQSIRTQYPNHRISICADDDNGTALKMRQTDIDKGNEPKPLVEYNAGIREAIKACQLVGGEMISPNFDEAEQEKVA